MGAWGADSLENDDATDWMADFCDAPDPAVIINTLSTVAEMDADQYLEAPDCSVALAAAEVVAALKKSPNPNLSDQTKNCISNLSITTDSSLIAFALEAIERIRTNSELKELWDESETPDEWYQAVSSLENRLRN